MDGTAPFACGLTRLRGSPASPVLMMSLDRGGSCGGIAYRLHDGNRRAQIARLLKRETDGRPATNVPRWITVEAANGPLQALAFVATSKGPAYVGRQRHGEIARVLASAAGHWGSAAQYL
jgi:cation transport protein ChaC